MQGGLKIFLVSLFVILSVGGVGGILTTFPDTATCTTTPTISFRDDVTMSKIYLLKTNCSAPADFNSGDFVTIWIEDWEGSPVYSVSQYVETDTGIEWLSPVSDNRGNAWDYLEVSQNVFDCNATGSQYIIQVSWDAQTTSDVFTVHCPNLTLKKFREELPYTEQLRLSVEVTDYGGALMQGVPCTAMVLQGEEDQNMLVVKQKTTTVLTDRRGIADFEFSASPFQFPTESLLINVGYETQVECLGATVSYDFNVVQAQSQPLRNPLYYGIIFIADNIVFFVLGIIALGVIVGLVWLTLRKD